MATEYEKGKAAARKEIKTDRWSKRTATLYLQMTSKPASDYDRGFDEAVRSFAQGAKA